MAHFAKIDQTNTVTKVIVAENDFINSGVVGDSLLWVQTSYNTRGGIHHQSNSNTPSINQSKAVRKNYAGIGYTYDLVRDAFIPPKPFPSWILNEFSCNFKAPTPYPNDGLRYNWNEDILNWIETKF